MYCSAPNFSLKKTGNPATLIDCALHPIGGMTGGLLVVSRNSPLMFKWATWQPIGLFGPMAVMSEERKGKVGWKREDRIVVHDGATTILNSLLFALKCPFTLQECDFPQFKAQIELSHKCSLLLFLYMYCFPPLLFTFCKC